MLTINTNIDSLFSNRMFSSGQNKLEDSMKKLSSGLRINSAKDDASGLGITDRMTSQIRGLNQAVRNINDGISMLQTAEGAMQEVTNLLQRGRELSVQAGSTSLSDSDLQSLQAEINQIKDEVNRIGNTTSFNGQFILKTDPAATSSGSLEQDKLDVQNGLRLGWLRNTEQMIMDGFGLQGTGGDLKVVYETNSGDGFVAWVANAFDPVSREAVSQELHIDLSDFIPVDSDDGGTAPSYNDRIIAHEMVHAVMGVTMNAYGMDTWFQEGSAELIQGGDERLLGAINTRLNGGDTTDQAINHLVATIGQAWNDGSDPTLLNEQYATAYAATRFLHDAIKSAGGTGMDELMGLLSSNKANNAYDLDEAFADLQAAHTSFAYADKTSFINDFTAANGAGFDYMKEVYTSGDLANSDTGAIGGLDADGGEIKTAESVVKNGARYQENPLEGFNTLWEDVSLKGDVVANLTLQVGAGARQSVSVASIGISSTSLNIDDINLASGSSAMAIVKFDQAIELIDENRGQMGAQMNRLEHAMLVASNSVENLSTARSRILDVDIAQETSQMTKQNIIQQAAVSMLSQAGIAPQLALKLLS